MESKNELEGFFVAQFVIQFGEWLFTQKQICAT